MKSPTRPPHHGMCPSTKEGYRPVLCVRSIWFLLAQVTKLAFRSFFWAAHLRLLSPVILPQRHGQANDYHRTPGAETKARGEDETVSSSGSESSAGSCLRCAFLAEPSASESGGDLGEQGRCGRVEEYCLGAWASRLFPPRWIITSGSPERADKIFTKIHKEIKRRARGAEIHLAGFLVRTSLPSTASQPRVRPPPLLTPPLST